MFLCAAILPDQIVHTGAYTMSNISDVHTVVAYTSGVTKPLSGQRLAKVTYKVDAKTGVKPASKAVSIPVLTWNEVSGYLPALQNELVELCRTAQDKIVRSKVESGQTSINESDISMSAIIEYLNEVSTGGRLTGDTIRLWFDDSLKEPLMLAFAPKLGITEDATPTPEQEAKLAKVLKGYEDSFARMASGAASFNDMQKVNMLKVLELVESEDSGLQLKDKFVTRLTKKIADDNDLLMSL